MRGWLLLLQVELVKAKVLINGIGGQDPQPACFRPNYVYFPMETFPRKGCFLVSFTNHKGSEDL
jgi:hypothetical protein